MENRIHEILLKINIDQEKTFRNFVASLKLSEENQYNFLKSLKVQSLQTSIKNLKYDIEVVSNGDYITYELTSIEGLLFSYLISKDVQLYYLQSELQIRESTLVLFQNND